MLIVIEGLDGSGKATQTAKLVEYLKNKGQAVHRVTFPDYDSPASAPLRMYLDGEMGEASDVNAYAASSFFAIDRFVSFQKHWKKDYEAGYTIISDRYTTSNAAHQMSKLEVSEWNSYLRWMEDFEYGRLELPRPDIVVYLDMNTTISQTLIHSRGTKPDIHEEDIAYLENCRKSALYAADRMEWNVIKCDDGEKPFDVETVFQKILGVLSI